MVLSFIMSGFTINEERKNNHADIIAYKRKIYT
jgi:hypothetical protein